MSQGAGRFGLGFPAISNDRYPMSAIIDRVRALLAKAESSPYPAEADAFTAKAQKLINEHAIDQARLRGIDPAEVGQELLPMSGTYTRERALIWTAVAHANRCQLLTVSAVGRAKVHEMVLIGREHDRDLVQLVATSLELQAMRRLGELEVDRTWESPVVQRRSFLRGFAIEVGDRLQRAGHDRIGAGEATTQALVLASDAVDRYVAEHFDVQQRRSQSRHDGVAFSHGRRAGASADVGSTRLGQHRKALPGAS